MKYIIPIIAGCIFLSCQKQDLPPYVNDPRINVEFVKNETVTDSVFYSFVIKNSSVLKDTILITAKIMGEPAEKDRIIKLIADSGETTAQEGTHYELGELVMPAHAYTARLPVIIKRSEDLKQKSVRLTLKVVSSDDFKPGVPESSRLVIVWNDILSKPANWDDLWDLIFGAYSRTKHQFINDHTNLADKWEDDEFIETISLLLFSYTSILREALVEYNNEHPGNPLRDVDTGDLISF
jgi:hypothetical protein